MRALKMGILALACTGSFSLAQEVDETTYQDLTKGIEETGLLKHVEAIRTKASQRAAVYFRDVDPSSLATEEAILYSRSEALDLCVKIKVKTCHRVCEETDEERIAQSNAIEEILNRSDLKPFDPLCTLNTKNVSLGLPSSSGGVFSPPQVAVNALRTMSQFGGTLSEGQGPSAAGILIPDLCPTEPPPNARLLPEDVSGKKTCTVECIESDAEACL